MEDDKKELWLGWLGVSLDERQKGYGTKIFKTFENYAKKNNFSTIRLFTDETDNYFACKLYEKMGMTKEYYENKDDDTVAIGKIVIYSKSLTKEKVTHWDNKFIDYKGQKKKERMG